MTTRQALLSFKGRLSRSDYWLKGMRLLLPAGIIIWILDLAASEDWSRTLSLLLSTLLSRPFTIEGQIGLSHTLSLLLQTLSLILFILSVWPLLALFVKRLHDRNHCGWFTLIALVPIAGPILLLFTASILKGTHGANRYGDDPLQLKQSAEKKPITRNLFRKAIGGICLVIGAIGTALGIIGGVSGVSEPAGATTGLASLSKDADAQGQDVILGASVIVGISIGLLCLGVSLMKKPSSPSVLQLLRRAFSAYKEDFAIIAGLMILVWLPCDLVSSYLVQRFSPEKDFASSLKWDRFFSNFVGIIALSGIFFCLKTRSLGTKPTFGASLESGLKHYGQMFWTRFVWGVFVYGSLLLGIVLGFTVVWGICLCESLLLRLSPSELWAKNMDNGVGPFIVIALGVAPCVFLILRFSLAEPLVVHSGISGLAALKRSFATTRGSRIIEWWLIAFAVAAILSVPLGLLLSVPSLGGWVAKGLISTAVGLPFAFLTIFNWAALEALVPKEAPPAIPDQGGTSAKLSVG